MYGEKGSQSPFSEMINDFENSDDLFERQRGVREREENIQHLMELNYFETEEQELLDLVENSTERQTNHVRERRKKFKKLKAIKLLEYEEKKQRHI